MCLKRELLITRKLWADIINNTLEREGFEERITEKSYAALGVNLTPTKHRGWVSDKLESMGIQSRIVDENKEITEENKNKIIQNPEILLHELTSKQATFTQHQLHQTIQKRLGDNDKCNANVFMHILEKSIYLGDGIDGMPRYTSTHYQMKEEVAIKTLASILGENKSHAVRNIRVDAYLNDHYAHMTDEQQSATLGLIKNDSLAVLLGRAGTGKTSTTVKAVCELYKQEGYTVIGGSLARLAADNLGSETGIKTNTLHAWLYCWDRYQQAEKEFLSFNNIVSKNILKQFQWYKDLKSFEHLQLNSKTVFIADEAGMIGTDLWMRFLDYARQRGAKVIAVGDDNQSKAIGAGDFFREIINQTTEKGCLFALNKIQRQKIDWMKTASEHFAMLNTQEGLALYEEKGHVHSIDSEYLEEEIAQHYVNRIASRELDDKGDIKYKTGLVLAFTNAQTKALNQAIRQKLRSTVIPGHILSDFDVLTLGKGEQATHFALGDKIVFLKNNNQHITLVDQYGEVITNRSISNGTTGILETVKDHGKEIVVRLDEATTAHFSIETYKDFNHGYALTIHKSQGQTVDFTLIAASRLMDALLTYVAMTRHRHDVHLFYSKEDFASYKEFALHMSRYTNKDLVKDYTIRPENTDAWHRVQEYQHCIYDASSLMKESIAENNPDWKAYLEIKRDQIQLGKDILNDFDAHQTYIHQAGLTHEMLQYTTGQKLRPLSVAEQKAKLNVEIYGETANVARELWNEIKLSTNKKEHPLYDDYQNLRAERDALAKDILYNYPLYREFVNHYSKEYGMSKRTLENQVSYREKSLQKQLLAEIKVSFNFAASQESLTNKHPVDAKGHEAEHMLSIQKRQNNTPSSKFTSFEKSTTEISNELREHIADLAIHFLGQPKQTSRCQWRYGNKGSIAIHVQGSKKGLYTNFESGVSGNAVSLIADQLGLTKKEAFKWGVHWLGYDHSRESMFVRNEPIHPKTDQQSEMNWKPIFPAPQEVPDLKNTPSLSYMMRGKVEVARYPYKDADSSILGYVVRLEDKNGQKITPTLTYCHNEHGQQIWRWNGFGEDRPLYGLEQLKDKFDALVLIVEGEKTCEAARMLFPDHVVITWSGGCGSVYKTDWSPLTGKDVILFPDHDEAGLKAMLKIGDLLNKQGNQSIHIIDIPSTLPHKWDLADAMPEHTTLQDLMSQAKTHAEMKFEVYQKTNSVYQKTFNYLEIKAFAQHNRSGHLLSSDNAPFMEYVANESYKELALLNTLSRSNISEDQLKHQAFFTSIYTTRFKEIAEQRKETPSYEHLLTMGVIAAKMNQDGKVSDHNVHMNDAKFEFFAIEKKISEHLKNPPDSIKKEEKYIKEGLIRCAYRFKTTLDTDMPSHLTKDIYNGLLRICPDTSHAYLVKGVIDHILSEKAKGEFSLHSLSHETVSFNMKFNQMNLQKALERNHDQSMHMEQQRNLDKELHRGVELTL